MKNQELHACVIPARLGSSRFPNKPLKHIAGIPMLGHVAIRCGLEPIFDRIIIATCDQEIMEYAASIGVEAIMTSDKHERASDRTKEAIDNYERKHGIRFTTVTMVQGDEPLVTPAMLRLSLRGLQLSDVPVTNLMSRITDFEEFNSPNCVKVVTNLQGFAHYFSRAPIPASHKPLSKVPKQALKQICIIGFKRDFLDTYVALNPTEHEILESIDMLRILDHGYPLALIETPDESYPVDVPSDIDRIERMLKSCAFFPKYRSIEARPR